MNNRRTEFNPLQIMTTGHVIENVHESISKLQPKPLQVQADLEILSEEEYKSKYNSLDNDYYMLVEKEMKDGKRISKEVYESLTEEQKGHFNHNYNKHNAKIYN